MLLQPAGDLIGAENGRLDLEPRQLALVGGAAAAAAVRVPGQAVGEGLVEPVAQHPELEGVEELVDRLPVPRPRHQVGRRGADRAFRQVADQRGELAVAQHAAEVLAQRVAGLALDLADAVDQLLERPELRDPLRRGLLPHAGDAGQVVAVVAAQRREIRVLGGRQPVLLDQRGRVVAPHVGHAAAVVQHGHVVGDQLERVPVAGDDEDVMPSASRLGGERRDDVVGLVARRGQVPDAERVEHLEDQADLAAELVRRLGPARLVLDVLLVPEGRLAAVERHRHVRRLLVAQHVDQHRGEAVDGVRGLAGGRGEVLHRQREERAVRQRVPVEQQQPVSHLPDPMTARRCLGRLRARLPLLPGWRRVLALMSGRRLWRFLLLSSPRRRTCRRPRPGRGIAPAGRRAAA